MFTSAIVLVESYSLEKEPKEGEPLKIKEPLWGDNSNWINLVWERPSKGKERTSNKKSEPKKD